MKFVIQRVSKASVTVDNNVIGKINKGFLVLIGVTHNDTKEIADLMIRKLLNLRVFSDENDKMNLSLKDVEGELLLISQFTLYANCKRGNRPDFINAAKPDVAKELYEYIITKCNENGYKVETGEFGADMKVELLNDGPVTIILDSENL
ncbi:MAG: D-tyrosyl-tRNA(Tyr) deacylase [Clostridia bacterium]|nr:D-tyrosyl-tRNA(Tyr) deacylase [Clostridia bacterium]